MMLRWGRINSRKTSRLTDNKYILPLFFYISSFCISFLKIPLPIIFSYFDQAELSVVSPVRVASCNLLIATSSSSSSHYSYFSPSSSPPPPLLLHEQRHFPIFFPKETISLLPRRPGDNIFNRIPINIWPQRRTGNVLARLFATPL